MNLIPFKNRDLFLDSFDNMSNFEDEITKLFKPISKLTGIDRGLFNSNWNPSIDVYESDDAVLIKADIPGLKRDEIDVSIDKDLLTIKGEKRREDEFNEKNSYRSERFYGSFSRTVQLHSEVDNEKVEATYKDGVLELKLPKKEEAKTKRISVKVE